MNAQLKHLMDWILEPLVEGTIFSPKKEQINANYIFRPKNFWEYIGQEKIKERLYYYIEGTKSRNLVFPHTLICGESGMGKTTLAQIIANELKVNFIETIASNFKNIDEIYEKILLCNGGVLFQDEIHSLPREIAEKMYPIMEFFKHEGINIKPFTLMGATTEFGEIIRDKKPFVRRFELQLDLEDYTVKDLIKIAKQYKEKMFKNDKLSEEIYEILARNSRNAPHTLIILLKSSIYFNGDVQKVLNNFGIIKDGFTYKDIKIMKYIGSNDKGVGLQSISNFLGTSPQNYSYNIEPFLLRNEIIVRTGKGRKITQRGIEILNELKGQ